MPRERLVELYRTYGRLIYVRCRRLLGDAQAAEDATQETFLRVHRHLDRAPNAEEALRWIYRVATNHCLNELRNRRRRATVPLDPGICSPTAAHDGPAGRLVDRATARAVILQVPEKLAVVAWLFHVDGLEQAEIASLLGISRRTVVNRLSDFQSRAKALLRST